MNWKNLNETQKTIAYAGGAIVLALLAFVTAPRPVTPDAFTDKGEPFFPDFTDPNVATTLEVVSYDDETGSAIPFKVTFKEGLWTIPSHHDYPADGKDRLAKTAALVIGLRKEDFRSDNISDHEACGVIDPLDESLVTSGGRGKRVTIKGENDQVLADIIIGKKVPDREGLRFVRLPGQKRIYVAKADFEISTKFADWIETDLLKVNRSDIKQVVLKDYSINERTLRVDQRDVVVLTKDGANWTVNNARADEEVDMTKMNSLLTAVDELKIVGVRPKPAGLSASLSKSEDGVTLTQADVLSLQSKGFYFSRDGQLLSNEGELQALTTDGVRYTIRFGEVVYGSGLEVTAGAEEDRSDDATEMKGPGENRYLFITTEFVEKEFPEPPQPKNTDFLNKADSLLTDADRENKIIYEEHEEWRKKVEKGRKLSQELNERFARWYYVISAESYDKIHLKRRDLLKKKEEKKS